MKGSKVNMGKETFTLVTELIKTVGKNEDIRGLVCGKYADGTSRSIPDAISGEFLSPKQKKKMLEKKKKKKNKKKHAKFKL